MHTVCAASRVHQRWLTPFLSQHRKTALLQTCEQGLQLVHHFWAVQPHICQHHHTVFPSKQLSVGQLLHLALPQVAAPEEADALQGSHIVWTALMSPLHPSRPCRQPLVIQATSLRWVAVLGVTSRTTSMATAATSRTLWNACLPSELVTVSEALTPVPWNSIGPPQDGQLLKATGWRSP